MFCHQCGEQIEEESNFCSYCGKRLRTADPSSDENDLPSSRPTTDRFPERPERKKRGTTSRRSRDDDRERTLWEGKFSGKAMLYWYIVYGLWLLIDTICYFQLFEDPGTVLHITYLSTLVIPLAILLFVEWKNKAESIYKVTTQRLVIRTGILSRKIEEIELVRVDDVDIIQTFFHRFVNVGTVHVYSTDETTPVFELFLIDNPMQVKEVLRNQVRKLRKNALFLESL